MPLIPPLTPKLPAPVQSVVTRVEGKLDHIIHLLEVLAAAHLHDQGLNKAEIADLLLPKK